jgi:hypothetical protein
MASVIDSHPQRQRIIDAILAGKSLRDIAGSVTPPVSIMAVQRYRQKTVAPIMANASVLAKVMQENGLQTVTGDVTETGKAACDVTKAVLLAAPVLAVREKRLGALQERHDRLRQLMIERGEEMEGEAPGGATGLLARKRKMIGSGPMAHEVTEYELDTGLLSEFREHEKQAAQELGQWQEGAASGPAVAIQIVCPAGVSTAQPSITATDDGCVTIDIAPGK